jgi:prepilin-type N-terminal cleavage/methylation domain-containing protein
MNTIPRVRGNQGFSMIEMAYVLMVLGILLAVSVPQFSGYLQATRLRGSMNELMSDLYYARSLAVSKRRTYQVEFDPSEYRIIETATGDTIRTRDLPTGFTCAASGNPNFYAWGLADPVNITITGGTSSRIVGLAANGNVSHW